METQREEQREELRWAGRPLAELLRLAWPIVVSMMSYSAMTLADTLFVGTLGPSALAGVGMGGLVMWAVICFPYGLLQGSKVLVSQAEGAGKRHRHGPLLAAALVWALALGALAAGVGLLFGLVADALTATAASSTAYQEYLGVRALGAPIVIFFAAEREVRQGLGDSRSPMVASVAANIVNVALDYVLIIGLGLGVAGAAWATVAASVVELALLVWVMRGSRPVVGRVRWRDMAATWTMGWPTGLQFFIEMGSFLLLSVLISRYAELDMAAHQVTIQVIHFSFMPAVALGEACAVMAGQAVGAGRLEFVRHVARMAMWVGGVYTGACGLLFAFGGGWLAGFFTTEVELVEMIRVLLWVAALFQVFDAASIIARGTLRGTGDVRFTALVGTVIAWMVLPPSMWLLGYKMGLGALGGWIGLFVEITAGAAIFWWRLERWGWRGAAARARALGAA